MATEALASGGALMSAEEVSALIGVSIQTLAVWRCSGRYALPFVRAGRRVRYRRSDVEAWLSRRTVGAVDGAADGMED